MKLLSALCHRYEGLLRQKTCAPEAFDFDYDHIVPWIARLPQPFADAFNTLRARFNACLQRDWLPFVISHSPSAAQRIKDGAQIISACTGLPYQELIYCYHYEKTLLDPLEVRIEDIDRFTIEWEGHTDFSGDQPRLWVAAHWGASIPGVAFIAARRQKRISGIATAALKRETVPAGFRHHVLRRYRNLEKYFYGGHAYFHEESPREIVRAFRRKEDMIVIFDMPAINESAIYLPFFGAQRGFRAGALRHAQRNDYLIQPYWVDYLGRDRMRVWCGEPVRASERESVEKALQVLLHKIERQPCKWFIFEQLPFYPVRS